MQEIVQARRARRQTDSPIGNTQSDRRAGKQKSRKGGPNRHHDRACVPAKHAGRQAGNQTGTATWLLANSGQASRQAGRQVVKQASMQSSRHGPFKSLSREADR